MGQVRLKDSEGNLLFVAPYGADVSHWNVAPQGDDMRLEEYENDGYILSLEIRDARIQLEKVLNKTTVSSGGPLGLGGYGGTTKLFLKPSMLSGAAPQDPDECYTLPEKIQVELEEDYTTCKGSLLGFRTDCNRKTANMKVEMWVQWKDGKIFLSQWPEAPTCPAKPAMPPRPPVSQEDPWLAASAFWESLKSLIGAPIAAIHSIFPLLG